MNRREFIKYAAFATAVFGGCRRDWQPVFDINPYLSEASIDAVVSSSGRYLATDKILYSSGRRYKPTEKVSLMDMEEQRFYNLPQNACPISVADNGSVLYYIKGGDAEYGPLLYRIDKPILVFEYPNWQISDSKLSHDGQVIGLTNNQGFVLLDVNTCDQILEGEGRLMAISGDGKKIIYRTEEYEPRRREKAYSYTSMDTEKRDEFKFMSTSLGIKADFMLSNMGNAFVLSRSYSSGRTVLNVRKAVKGNALAPLIGYNPSAVLEGIGSLRQIIRVEDDGTVYSADGRVIKFIARRPLIKRR